MAKRKGPTYEEMMSNLLKTLPFPIVDNRHNINIYFYDDRARSNQNRFDHIIDSRHELLPGDIKRIQKCMKKAIFKKDKERTNTFNIYITRNNYGNEYIKISLKIEPEEPHRALVKTVFITKVIK
ncbi:MAG: hypothetical protein E7175_05315 [Erysipelotrichaceae bacterium]|nr:hypothetical protein [Erysipelotrichaceae bacterium]